MRFAICDLKKDPHPDPLPEYRKREEEECGKREGAASARGIRVAIAGAGLVTALGDSAEETWGKLVRGEAIADHAMVKKEWGGRSRVVGLAIDAGREAILETGWSNEQIEAAGLVVGTSKGKIIEWIESGMCGAGVGDVASEVAGVMGMGFGPRLTVSGACASGLLALIRGALMIKAGEAKRVMVVAAEASVHEMFVGSFRRLGVLARAGEGCRPFDEGRSGFLMSEAGAAVCLEGVSEEDGGGVLIERMAMGGDATHL
ncbi:MAG TPA: beta-ketoacyl synthase N-terminal-like domain-containing protein, partial [Tepidisphaeraceae bacterium]|nr:beta-ketoacyl synthase N-terminal-like domain-containing protein [Tepidisphaeraceae bacterium]